MIPYEIITFENIGGKFIAKIDLDIYLTDKDNNRVDNRHLQKTIEAENYNSSQGAKAEFVKYFFQFPLESGSYTVVSKITDSFSSNSYERKREISVIEFNKFSLSLSGILLLSQIEEVNGKYKITPFISDNIGNLDDNFFAFFEVYNQNSPKTINVAYKLLKKDELIKGSELKQIEIPVGKKQSFLQVDISDLSLSGEYMLQIIAYDGNVTSPDSENILAITQRSVKHDESLFYYVDQDVDNAIRMLRYVAKEDEIERIEKTTSEAEKKEKLLEFWKERDPSPNTSFNEAMSEYYQRIKYANEQFKSYTDGWLTDMGMVYIVLGPPMQVEKESTFGNNIQYRLWRYSGNRTFLFADKNGFGNYRLERPYLFNEKYRYKK
jgi:GWxTD domain-containing protein